MMNNPESQLVEAAGHGQMTRVIKVAHSDRIQRK